MAQHPRNRKDVRARTHSQTRAGVPEIVWRDRLHLRPLNRPIKPARRVMSPSASGAGQIQRVADAESVPLRLHR